MFNSIVSEYNNTNTQYGISFYSSNVNAGTNLMRLDMTNTRVGINCNAPAYTLDVNGQTNISGSNTGVFSRITNTSLTGPAVTGNANN